MLGNKSLNIRVHSTPKVTLEAFTAAQAWSPSLRPKRLRALVGEDRVENRACSEFQRHFRIHRSGLDPRDGSGKNLAGTQLGVVQIFAENHPTCFYDSPRRSAIP